MRRSVVLLVVAIASPAWALSWTDSDGDQPDTPGCLTLHTDDECKKPHWTQGDHCSGLYDLGKKRFLEIEEYMAVRPGDPLQVCAKDTCCPLGHTIIYNCRKRCIAQGAVDGYCAVKKDHCKANIASAQCECEQAKDAADGGVTPARDAGVDAGVGNGGSGGGDMESCGDGACSVDELLGGGCDVDCAGPACGNGVCEAGEASSSCGGDCPMQRVSACGDGDCSADEHAGICASDCFRYPTLCGNGICELGESASCADCF
jgi:hypothetical protein